MKSFKAFITERASHTDIADVNEILLGYYCAGGDWSAYEDSNNVKRQYESKVQKLADEQVEQQDDRAKRMARETLKWAKSNGYRGRVAKVWWTARKGSLQRAVGKTGRVDSGNPTDTLLQFTSGDFLGLSAKSTLGETDIGFKNPGMGTIERLLNIDLSSIKKQYEQNFIDKYDLPTSAKDRKKAIRADSEIKSAADEQRTKLMNEMRDRLLSRLNSLSESDAREHIVSNWLDAAEIIYPSYIKVTGTRSGVLIENPLENTKLEALNKGDIEFSAVGNDSVGVTASGKKIMKMRFKYESQALASSMKMSGDPW
jgi:hypothetical protein